MKLGLKLGLIKHNFKKEILTRQTIITYLKKKIVKNYITSKIIQKNKNDYNPEINGKKYIIIMACHCDSELKLTTISNNIKYFSNINYYLRFIIYKKEDKHYLLYNILKTSSNINV